MSEPARATISADPPARTAVAPLEFEAPPQGSRSRWVGILMALALAVVTVLFILQMRRADSLEAEVGRLSGELEASQRMVDAYRGHLGEVRGQVGTLSAQMQTLQDLVDSDPEAAQAPSQVPAVPAGPDQAL